jgi:hypothetical protein
MAGPALPVGGTGDLVWFLTKRSCRLRQTLLTVSAPGSDGWPRPHLSTSGGRYFGVKAGFAYAVHHISLFRQPDLAAIRWPIKV